MDKQFEYDHQILQEETPLHEAEEIYYPPQNLKNQAFIRSVAHYNELYRQSMEEPNKFWKSVAKELHFEKWSDKGLEYNFDHRKGEIFMRFMEGAKTNMAYNCLERNIQKGINLSCFCFIEIVFRPRLEICLYMGRL